MRRLYGHCHIIANHITITVGLNINSQHTMLYQHTMSALIQVSPDHPGPGHKFNCGSAGGLHSIQTSDTAGVFNIAHHCAGSMGARAAGRRGRPKAQCTDSAGAAKGWQKGHMIAYGNCWLLMICRKHTIWVKFHQCCTSKNPRRHIIITLGPSSGVCR